MNDFYPIEGSNKKFVKLLYRKYGDFPIALSLTDTQNLKKMEASWKGNLNPFKQLVNIVKQHLCVSVHASDNWDELKVFVNSGKKKENG